MSLTTLNFETRDAACYSLRVMAELVRTGDMNIRLHDIRDHQGQVRLDLETAQATRDRQDRAR